MSVKKKRYEFSASFDHASTELLILNAIQTLALQT